MRISYSLGSLLTVEQVLECSKRLPDSTDTVWIPETWGMENFAMLAAVSRESTKPRIGSSIINIYSRSPATIAMGAATIDTLSGGRLVLGLGTSSPPIVESFHGSKFQRPLRRMREYVEIVRLALSGNKVDYSGEIFHLRDFALLVRPKRQVPIYLAAVNPAMIDLAWELGDGVIFYLRPLDEMKKTIQKMHSKKRIDVSCQIITSVADDSQKAMTRAKKTLAFYVSVGRIYREFLAANGFERETASILEEYKKSGIRSCHEMVPDSMVRSLCIAGTPDECKMQLGRFAEAGIDLPILQFNPVGDVSDSFGLFIKTFDPQRGQSKQ
ncbi:MAG: LLM class flavin-dependent oxidoreductase [Nitrosopumilus sp. H8]|nr:MAG: LLM class flavin-dependent oxidoreductase [Nitrosopumilus sp. H8]